MTPMIDLTQEQHREMTSTKTPAPTETADDSAQLTSLRATFDACGLGDGDPVIGTNVLVAMAVTLANVSRTGSGIATPGSGRLRAGGSLLTSGGNTSSLVRDKVIEELAIRQNNLLSQLRRLLSDKIADAKRQGLKAAEFPEGPNPNHSSDALFQLEQRDSLTRVHDQDVLDLWAQVLALPANPRIDDLAARPKILVSARGPRDLENQLRGLHGNRPLVVFGLNHPETAARLAETCHSLLDGNLPCDDWGETATGHLLVTDPHNTLTELSGETDGKVSWLGRLVWLVDRDGETDWDGRDTGAETTPTIETRARFGEALTSVLSRRLDNHNAGTVLHELDLGQAQRRWAAFLRKTEQTLPGVTEAARGLLATLAFGLTELAQAAHCPKLKVSVGQVEALARWIIRRMARARIEMLDTTEQQRWVNLAFKILELLKEGALTPRELYRRLTIPAESCHWILRKMGSADLVQPSQDKWECKVTEPIRQSDIEQLFLLS